MVRVNNTQLAYTGEWRFLVRICFLIHFIENLGNRLTKSLLLLIKCPVVLCDPIGEPFTIILLL